VPALNSEVLADTSRGRGDPAGVQRSGAWRRRLGLGAVLAALLIAVPICAPYRQRIWHQIQLSVVRQPLAYDELYFASSLNLPVRISSGIVADVAFDIRRDGPPTRVRYRVFVIDSRGTSTISQGSVRLRAVSPSVVVEAFRIPVKGAFELGVQLLPAGPAIGFHGQAL
jgi:hypothetical protein